MSPAFFKHALGRPAAGFTTAQLAAGGHLQAESSQPSCQERKSCQAQHAGIGREKRRAGREATRLPRRAGSFRSAPGMASSRRTTASTEYPEAGGPDGRGESFTSARSFGQASMHSTGSGALSNQARPAGLPRLGSGMWSWRLGAGPPVAGCYEVNTEPQGAVSLSSRFCM